jgi:hypothetical protein
VYENTYVNIEERWCTSREGVFLQTHHLSQDSDVRVKMSIEVEVKTGE